MLILDALRKKSLFTNAAGLLFFSSNQSSDFLSAGWELSIVLTIQRVCSSWSKSTLCLYSGVGTKIDPTLCRADRMVGQVLGAIGALPEIFTELEISYFLLRRLLGVRTEGDKKAAKVSHGKCSPSSSEVLGQEWWQSNWCENMKAGVNNVLSFKCLWGQLIVLLVKTNNLVCLKSTGLC